MSPTTSKTERVMNQFKLWLFPALVSILAGIIYKEVLEIRSDVKALLAQSNVDKTKIEQLQKQVELLNNVVFLKKMTSKVASSEGLQYDKFFKHEDFYNINEQIITEKI